MEPCIFGSRIIRPGMVESTNTCAMNLLQEEELTEGAVIFTQEQTRGKGQHGSDWISAPFENLTFSLVLRPAFLPPVKQFFLSMCMALGVADYVSRELRKYDKTAPVLIKWPNDILAGGRKVAGILIENMLSGNRFRASVCGIGINLNQDFSGAPFTAGSLGSITGRRYDPEASLSEVLSCLEVHYVRLREGMETRIREEYISRLFALNENMRFAYGENVFEGSISGIATDGKLMVRTQEGEKRFGIKELRYPA